MEELAHPCYEGEVSLINHLIKFAYLLDEDGKKSKHKPDM